MTVFPEAVFHGHWAVLVRTGTATFQGNAGTPSKEAAAASASPALVLPAEAHGTRSAERRALAHWAAKQGNGRLFQGIALL